MPLWLCSAMWQWAIHSPGLETSSRMSTVSPARSSTVSFHTRLGSGCPSRDRMRNRPAPWTWNGWCIGWSESISLTSRIFTRSPTVNDQLISPFTAPVSRSISCQIMLPESDTRLISGIRSSHSRPSPWSWLCAASWCGSEAGASGASEGTSFIPHLGQVPGSVAVTSGCIGQA